MSQAEVALKLGRDQSYIAKIEKGERFLLTLEFFDLCDILELNLDDVRVAHRASVE